MQICIILARVAGENRNQVPVNLDGNHIARGLAKPLRQCPDSGPDCQNNVFLPDSRGGDDLLDHVPVNQKVLPEFLLKIEIVPL